MSGASARRPDAPARAGAGAGEAAPVPADAGEAAPVPADAGEAAR